MGLRRGFLSAVLFWLAAGCSSPAHDRPEQPRPSSSPTGLHVEHHALRSPAAPAGSEHAPIVEPAPEASAAPACPTGMALVEGEHCPEVQQHCLQWMDPPGRWHLFRCAVYAQPAVCRAPRQHKRYCMDVDEQGSTPEDPRPKNFVTYKAASASCAARGARLCTESEYEFACEGEEMRPYPYGFARDSTACNIDRDYLHRHDERSAAGQNLRCVSPFGIRDLSGNLEEWATRDRLLYSRPTLLKGSWWQKGKNTCRATNAGHGSTYGGRETGYRCCAEARPDEAVEGG
jgi:formylglycine-generating enzyme